MSRELFEKHAKDLDYNISFSELWQIYTDSATQKAWRIWNAALAERSPDVVPEKEQDIIVPVSSIHNMSISFTWSQRNCGFGQLGLSKHGDKFALDNEMMSRRWSKLAVISAINAAIDVAEIR